MLATYQNHKLRRIHGESQNLEIQKIEMQAPDLNHQNHMQPLFSAATTDLDADIKIFKEILNELQLKTHTKNGYKFSPDAKMAAGWWFFEIYLEQEFVRKIIESDLTNKKKKRDIVLNLISEQLKKRNSKAKIRFYDNYSFMRRYWSWLMK